MSTAGRTPAPSEAVAADLREASFVHLLPRASGDALAAAGLLARAVRERGTPFQVTITRTARERRERADQVADGLALAIGPAEGVDRLDSGPATGAAWSVARDLGDDPDPGLALAGTVAAGVTPGADGTHAIVEAAEEAGITRRPGVATPTTAAGDVGDTTLAHAPFSGDPGATREAVAGVEGLDPDAAPDDEDAHRRLASLLALAVAADGDGTVRGSEAVERALRPYATPDGPFATAGGYADVLRATARVRPGTGVALALGHDAREAAVDAWRSHARRAHQVLGEATTGRYDGLLVARASEGAPVTTAARLLRDFRSPEPAALAVAEGEAALRTGPDQDPTSVARLAAAELDGEWDSGPRAAYLRFDRSTKECITAVREAMGR